MQKRTDSTPSEVSFDHPVERQLLAHWPLSRWSDVTVLVAVSGGADSVALLSALRRLAPQTGQLIVAHYNHQWRSEADQDERFVGQLAGAAGLRSVIGRAPTPVGSQSEAEARRSRYAFLRQSADQLGARYVATAHTADDQVETLLFRMLRGTGIRGLRGIPRTRRLSEAATLIRPLLGVPRGQLRDYLCQLGQTWREDTTNQDPRRMRNRIRHHLLPQLERHYQPAIRQRLLNLAAQAEALDELVDQTVHRQLERSRLKTIPGRVIQIRFYPDQLPYLRCEMLRRVWREQGWPLRAMGLAEWTGLAGLEERPGGVHILPGAITARHDGPLLHLQRDARRT